MQCLDGPFQHRGEADIEAVTSGIELDPGLTCLFHPTFRQVDVSPTSEQIPLVPDTLAVTKQDERGRQASARSGGAGLNRSGECSSHSCRYSVSTSACRTCAVP
jgi:hypothetical protein